MSLKSLESEEGENDEGEERNQEIDEKSQTHVEDPIVGDAFRQRSLSQSRHRLIRTRIPHCHPSNLGGNYNRGT